MPIAKPMVTALVPMKHSSHRVPGKNTRPMCGEPLFYWILRSLEASKHIRSIAVDTDSEVIWRGVVARFDKVRLIERPESLRGDDVPVNAIIAYDLATLDGEHFLQTHSTNPLLTAPTTDRAIEFYFQGLGQHDSLFSVTRHQARMYWGDGRAINHNPEELLPTQELLPLYEENSCFYLFSRTSFELSGKRRIGLAPRMFELDKLEGVDIDEEQDLRLVEALMAARLAARDHAL